MLSSDRPYLVTGASGNIGREVARALLTRGAAVRAGARADSDLSALPASIERVTLDFENPASFELALTDVAGVFLMRPPQLVNMQSTLKPFVDAAARAGVDSCVFLSVAGAEKNRMIPHAAVEQHLQAGPLPWTILRPGFFAQNLTGPYRRDIREGRIVLPAGDGRVAFVDGVDLGEAAAVALLDPQRHGGRSYHLTGPEAISFHRVAALLSYALGRRVDYEPASLFRYWRHARRQGLPRVRTAVLALLHMALRKDQGATVSPDLARLLNRTPRGMAQFIADNLQAWRI